MGEKRKAVIFLNGEPPREQAVSEIDFRSSFVICADGAADYASKFCRPDLLIGDFDSITSHGLFEDVDMEKFPVKKNCTDAQLAVERAARLGFEEIEIYGAFGLRPDHELVNYALLPLAHSLGCVAVLKGGMFDVFFVARGKEFVMEVEKDKIVSLVPYSDSVHILYTEGLLYEAKDVCVDKINVFTSSNAACGGVVRYCLDRGTALLFVEN
ncbi:MAG: thiamine diphosphokinase [Clostridia bacterium]|nr:thiamine diphosphokinase [Clostridia bacterium]